MILVSKNIIPFFLVIFLIIMGISGAGEAAPVDEKFPATDLLTAVIGLLQKSATGADDFSQTVKTRPFQTAEQEKWHTTIEYPDDWLQQGNLPGGIDLFVSPDAKRGTFVAIAVPVITGYENTPQGLAQLENLATVKVKNNLGLEKVSGDEISFLGLPGKEIRFSGSDATGAQIIVGIVYTVIDHRIYEIDYGYRDLFHYPQTDVPVIRKMIDSFTIDLTRPSVVSVSESFENNPVIYFHPATTAAAVSGFTDVSVVMDTVPSGLSGYQIQISLSNPSLGEITEVKQPGWAGLFSVDPPRGSSVTVKAADTAMDVNPGDTDILLATVTIQGKQEGECTINLIPDIVDDDISDRYNPTTVPGIFTVTGPGPGPSLSLDLYPGWNCVSSPRQLAPGYDTASLFSTINTAGRSIWLYDAVTGSWISADAETIINPMQGIWIYSEDQAMVTLIFKPIQKNPEITLMRGWNLFGPGIMVPGKAKDVLVSIQSSWTQILSFDAGSQIWEPAMVNGGNGQFSDERLINPGRGYWIYMTEKAHLTER
ncbi:MAG: hypothetical protein JXA44_10475 [Methanospirillaceae archaeon]|nr:hypothetical protein [Methanospirillaceae archaeon]